MTQDRLSKVKCMALFISHIDLRPNTIPLVKGMSQSKVKRKILCFFLQFTQFNSFTGIRIGLKIKAI